MEQTLDPESDHPPYRTLERPDLRRLPDPGRAVTIDDLVRTLRETKIAVGDPSIRELTRRVNRRRLRTGWPPCTPSTIGYLFSFGRARLDRELLLDVLVAMQLPERVCSAWARAWRATTASARDAA